MKNHSPFAPHHFSRDQYYLIPIQNHVYEWIVLPFDLEQSNFFAIAVVTDIHITRQSSYSLMQVVMPNLKNRRNRHDDGWVVISMGRQINLDSGNGIPIWAATSMILLVTLHTQGMVGCTPDDVVVHVWVFPCCVIEIVINDGWVSLHVGHEDNMWQAK